MKLTFTHVGFSRFDCFVPAQQCSCSVKICSLLLYLCRNHEHINRLVKEIVTKSHLMARLCVCMHYILLVSITPRQLAAAAARRQIRFNSCFLDCDFFFCPHRVCFPESRTPRSMSPDPPPTCLHPISWTHSWVARQVMMQELDPILKVCLWSSSLTTICAHTSPPTRCKYINSPRTVTVSANTTIF